MVLLLLFSFSSFSINSFQTTFFLTLPCTSLELYPPFSYSIHQLLYGSRPFLGAVDARKAAQEHGLPPLLYVLVARYRPDVLPDLKARAAATQVITVLICFFLCAAF